MMKLYVFGLCLLSGLFSAPAFAQEAPTESIPNVFISEINWAGSSLSTADEWIELFNASSESVDLSGWVLTSAATSGNALAIADGFSAAAQSTVLISNYGLGNEKTTLATEPNLVTSSLSLPNDGLAVMLVMPDGAVVDEVTEQIGSSNPFVSMVRLEDGSWATSTSSLNLLDANQFGTPGTHGVLETIEQPATEEPIETVNTEPATDPEPAVPEPVVEEVPVEDPAVTVVSEEPEPTVDPIIPAEEAIDPTIEPEIPAEPTVEPEIILEPEPIPEPEPVVIETPDEPAAEQEPIIDPQQIEEPTIVEEPDFQPLVASPELTPPTEFLSGSVLINEIVSDPKDGIEFIELYNPGESEIDLTDWAVKDASGKSTILSGSIAKKSYFVIENPKGKLNNDGDDVILNDPNGNIIDQTSYGDEIEAPDADESLARDGSTFIITTTITKGSQNILPAPEVTTNYENDLTIDPVEVPSSEENEPEIVQNDLETSSGSGESVSDPSTVHKVVAIATPESVKTTKATTKSSTKSSSSKSSNSVQTVTGMVTALPGTFGTQIAFIDGIQLYFYDADWPALAIGDVVSVRGTPSTSHGEPRIKIANTNDITVLRHQEPEPVSISTGSIATQKEGSLVSVTGRIVEQDDEKIVLQNDSGELTVVAHKNTGINWLDYAGSEITVVGIVRSFDDGVMLYPRSAEDITLVEEALTSSNNETIAPVASSKPIYPYIGGGLAALGFGALVYWYISSQKLMIRTPQLKHSNT